MKTPSPTLATGTWGGQQVTLFVDEARAVLKLGCAEGEFAAPVRLDRKGQFALDGTFSAAGGGPSTPDDRPVKSRYEGVLKDGRLSLTVRHGASVETYQLDHGVQSKVIRCL